MPKISNEGLQTLVGLMRMKAGQRIKAGRKPPPQAKGTQALPPGQEMSTQEEPTMGVPPSDGQPGDPKAKIAKSRAAAKTAGAMFR